MSNESEIRPFRADVPDEAIADLRRRIAATRWPSRELVADRAQGVQLATITELARYWATDYDWRKCEARLNALPQFTTEIDGEDIYFIHVMISGSASACGDLTWMKWMSTPSISVVNCGSAFSLASHLRQS